MSTEIITLSRDEEKGERGKEVGEGGGEIIPIATLSPPE